MTRPITIAALSSLLAPLAAAQDFVIDWYSIDGGAARSTAPGLDLQGAIGQPDASRPLTGGAFTLTGGYMVVVEDLPCALADTVQPFGVIDVNDILRFAIDYAAASPRADLFPDGRIDINDVLAFANAFAAGCS